MIAGVTWRGAGEGGPGTGQHLPGRHSSFLPGSPVFNGLVDEVVWRIPTSELTMKEIADSTPGRAVSCIRLEHQGETLPADNGHPANWTQASVLYLRPLPCRTMLECSVANAHPGPGTHSYACSRLPCVFAAAMRPQPARTEAREGPVRVDLAVQEDQGAREGQAARVATRVPVLR